MSNLQPNCCLKFDFQKVDQHAGGKWLIHDTKCRKDNQLQSLKLPYPNNNVFSLEMRFIINLKSAFRRKDRHNTTYKSRK